MRFGVLGPLRVQAADGTPASIPGGKVSALLAALLARHGQAVSADRLIEDLWGDRLPAHPANTLQINISQLRRALELAEPGGRELVAYQPSGYRLLADAVDAAQFEALTARARASAELRVRVKLLAEALELWRGPAFADFAGQEFAGAAIQRLEELRLVALEEQAQTRLELGEHQELADELAELVSQHPLRERLRGVHLSALHRAGRTAEAEASFRWLRERLAEDAGLDPSPTLVARYEEIVAAGPIPTPVARSTNLPVPLTELVGRHEEVREVRALLDTARLVTLTGPGGVGKTRLAVEAAGQSVAAFADGVWLVELAALGVESEIDAVAQEVMAALGLREELALGLPAGEPIAPAERLASALRTRELVLVLDNCEHVVRPVAELAGLLLKAAPGLRIMATSQDPLAVTGEVLVAVAPLDQPSAARLFVARATAAAPGFALDGDSAAAVDRICRRLDGIPLALELAATRVRVLGVAELAARLDDRFRLLTGGQRGAPARQQTLRAVIDWSWDLLTPAERIVLRRLAVHAEGCTLQAAESVCAGAGVAESEVLDLVARLVDRSLVVVTDSAGGPRYRLLESVAAYCLHRLREAGEDEPVRQRHHHYYLDLAERAEPQLYGHQQHQWLTRLDLETANLRTALEGLAKDRGRALRLVTALAWYWFLRGRFSEARRALGLAVAADGAAPAAAMARAGAWQVGMELLAGQGGDWAGRSLAAVEQFHQTDDLAGQARAEWFLSYALYQVGDLPTSEHLANQALPRFQELGDQWGVAATLNVRAHHALTRGELAAVESDGAQSFALFRELGDRGAMLHTVYPLAELAEITGDYERAAGLHREGLRVAEELGVWAEVSDRLSGLGRIALLGGDYAKARELHERALRIAAAHGFKPGELYAELGLALGARREGRLDRAEAHLRHVLGWYRQVDFEMGTTLMLVELGFVAELRGDAAAAMALHLEGFAAAGNVGDPRALAFAMEGMAGAAAGAGRADLAARLLGSAAAARSAAGAPLPPAERGDVDRITAVASKALGEQGFAAEFDHGSTLTPDRAHALVGGVRHYRR